MAGLVADGVDHFAEKILKDVLCLGIFRQRSLDDGSHGIAEERREDVRFDARPPERGAGVGMIEAMTIDVFAED
ncbi:hypothetical protein [Mycobacterium shimoidei]|uniref:hypothetical protein n=1 Tax=Mycobacterium shimoidei TaxID=29313 RepID=UPI0008495BBC|nr:hypothetical protein [Mycobacterium shimoidei]MCV7259640.1 hypothetical protein [Mycobacterium shimoidei]ODR12213.1 hypothetical protein BHQ16_16830 [Mycobacterium shimoidei]ORW77047.1 hypothetical protein AWC26_19985 [Mycobacterium shimoidei]